MLFRRYRTAATQSAGTRTCSAPTPRAAVTTLPSATLSCVQPASETPMYRRVLLDWGSATRGARRDHNEDSFCTAAPVFVVADGMGGHAAGELASSAVAASMATLGGCSEVTDAEIGRCITEARNRIGHVSFVGGKPPGSTLSGVIVTEGANPCWTVLNIGDSRTYLLDGEALTQLTNDHSVAQELVDQGAISVSDARNHRFAHVLTRSITHDEVHLLDVNQIPLHRGDRILVCSDGVSGPLDNDVLADLLRSHADPRDAATAVIAAVVNAGGVDDATAVVIDALNIV
ncbi:serine/threonine protein phosphatase PrpC [Mycobacterium sp. MAA66]|uniref:PP2C family protein-serine/threonine phosphatase n=1 Tax=Mycobacterium sp. MAA66 TaxID=3156297 RepID=UPI0035178DAB